ncbi:MAG: DNA polymerase III subunit delta [Candidatus Izemoplasmatales bacterium]|nr:DNA polymerase III subunit delta [Candidatus Izemoplasmatales bacterium]
MNRNCYLFYGEDHFLIKKETDLVFQENEIDLLMVEVYDGEEEGLDNAVTNAMTLPFLSDKKGVVIKNAQFLTTNQSISDVEAEKLISFCEMKLEQTIMVIQVPSDNLDFKGKLAKYLTKNVIVKKFVINDKNFDVYDYVKKEIAKHNLKIQPFALTQFINRANTNMDNLNNELQKLIYYAYNLGEINADVVFEVVSREIEDNIFDLVNALLENNREKVFKVYYDLVDHNVKTTQILAVVGSKFLEILYTKALMNIKYSKVDIEKFFGYSSGRVYYMMKNAQGTSDDVLFENIKNLEELDFQIKSGRIDKDLGPELYFLGGK